MKFTLSLALAISLMLNIYLYQNQSTAISKSEVINITTPQKLNTPINQPQKHIVSIKQAALEKASQLKEDDKIEESSVELEELKISNIDSIHDINDFEERSNRVIKRFFLEDLNLSEDDFKEYTEIKINFQHENSNTFKEEDILKKDGAKIIYKFPTFEEEEKRIKIKRKYLNQLKDQIGQSNYKKYRELIDKINNQNMESKDENSPFYMINF